MIRKFLCMLGLHRWGRCDYRPGGMDGALFPLWFCLACAGDPWRCWFGFHDDVFVMGERAQDAGPALSSLWACRRCGCQRYFRHESDALACEAHRRASLFGRRKKGT